MTDFLVSYFLVAAVMTLTVRSLGVRSWKQCATVAALWPLLLPIIILGAVWFMLRLSRYGVSR